MLINTAGIGIIKPLEQLTTADFQQSIGINLLAPFFWTQALLPELEALVGSVVELGRITETPTPTIDAIYAATSLLSHTLGRQNGRLQVQTG